MGWELFLQLFLLIILVGFILSMIIETAVKTKYDSIAHNVRAEQLYNSGRDAL